MKISFYKYFIIAALINFAAVNASAQIFEWRLVNPVISAVDPDGAGPATGSATFTMQIHTTGGSVPDVSAISVGWNYQSDYTMIPTSPAGPGCPSTVSNPANVIVSPYFVAGGFAYTTVNQCGIFNQVAGGQSFDRRAVGTLDGTGVFIGTTWVDVYTVTLWTLGGSSGGFVSINSGAGGSPGEFTTYAVSNVAADEFVVNSLTYTTPLELGSPTPVTFTKFNAQCNNSGALITWTTANESNSSHFDIERSINGIEWKHVARINAAGQSSSDRNYQQIDLGSAGNSMYRIKQVDLDGKITYTDVVRTNCDSKMITSVIYPVPAIDRLNVVIKSDRAIKTQLVVYDALGQVVRKMDATITTGNNNFIINVANLPSGHYSVRSLDPAVNLNKPFVIAH